MVAKKLDKASQLTLSSIEEDIEVAKTLNQDLKRIRDDERREQIPKIKGLLSDSGSFPDNDSLLNLAANLMFDLAQRDQEIEALKATLETKRRNEVLLAYIADPKIVPNGEKFFGTKEKHLEFVELIRQNPDAIFGRLVKLGIVIDPERVYKEFAGAMVRGSISKSAKKANAKAYENPETQQHKKQQAKKKVYQDYLLWRDDPARYPSKAEFSRRMLVKHTALESQKKIEPPRNCRRLRILRGLRYRRLRPPDHRSARGQVDAHGPGPGCLGAGHQVALSAGGRDPSFGPRVAIPD